MRIWLVEVSRGEYSDRSDWVDSAWSTQEAAERRAATLWNTVSFDETRAYANEYELDDENAAPAQ